MCEQLQLPDLTTLLTVNCYILSLMFSTQTNVTQFDEGAVTRSFRRMGGANVKMNTTL